MERLDHTIYLGENELNLSPWTGARGWARMSHKRRLQKLGGNVEGKGGVDYDFKPAEGELSYLLDALLLALLEDRVERDMSLIIYPDFLELDTGDEFDLPTSGTDAAEWDWSKEVDDILAAAK